MQLYCAFGVHLALFVEAERFWRLAEQFGFLRVVLIEGQATTIQGLQRQFPGFFSSVGPQFR